MKNLLRIFAIITLVVTGAVGLFVWEGIRENWKHPEIRTAPACCVAPSAEAPDEERRFVRVLTWNLAKAEFHRGGFRFAAAKDVRTRLDAMADVIREARADIIVLTEIVGKSGLVDLDHVEHLAHSLKVRSWVFGANYSFGIPGLRIQAGKAILTREPLRDARAIQLAGARPFWNPTNNRRLLLATIDLGGRSWTVGAVRNDSYSLEDNLVHAREVLDACAGHECLLAGDFNAPPRSASMRAFENSGRFSGAYDGPATLMGSRPDEPGSRIDFVLAPKSWKLVKDEVLESELSDHRPVVAEFELP